MGKQHCARRLLAAALVLTLAGGLLPASAAEVEVGAVYCFQSTDFDILTDDSLTGVCITAVPGKSQGTILLGSRVICPGDILTAGQLNNMTFRPADTHSQDTQVFYLPIYGTTVEQEAVMTISIQKKENQPPVAKDGSFETYKNLEKQGTLDVSDPEGEPLRYTLVKPPKRGSVVIADDGTFTYTPKKNKVGKDCFTFTVTDAQGAVSDEAIVGIEILKPLDANTYKDVNTGQFEALWMKNTGLFSGFQVAGEACFGPDEQVSRGDFLAMAMKLLEIPLDEDLTASGFADENTAAQWLLPYLATAMRLGVVSGSVEQGEVVFRPNDPITGAEAAVMLENMLLLPASQSVQTDAPEWAAEAVQAMAGAGIPVKAPAEKLTRQAAAEILYAVSKISDQAPGLEVFRRDY